MAWLAGKVSAFEGGTSLVEKTVKNPPFPRPHPCDSDEVIQVSREAGRKQTTEYSVEILIEPSSDVHTNLPREGSLDWYING